MPITPYPTEDLPSLARPAAFSNDAISVFSWLTTSVVPAFNDVLPAIEAAPTLVADALATALAAANFKGTWADQAGAAAVPYAVAHDSKYWQLVTNLADVTASEPGVGAEWVEIPTAPELRRMPKTANYTLVEADKGRLIEVTAGSVTLSFAAAADLGDGWSCLLANSGTGDVTLDPAGAETIDGLASYIMYPGEMRLVMCDGAVLWTKVLNAYAKDFTSTAPFVWPPGYLAHEGDGWGGGSGGGGNNTGSSIFNGAGGGGAPGVPFSIRASEITPGATETITIGAGGAGGVGNVSAGVAGSGGNSSIGALRSFLGGIAGGSAIAAGASGTLAAGLATPDAADGLGGGAGGNTAGGIGGAAYRGGGGGGGGAPSGGSPGAGGSSVLAGAGGSGGASGADGQAGVAPGGAGGGAGYSNSAARNGGPGARGEIRMRGVI